MADEIINSYIDANAIKLETDAFIKELERAKAGFDDLKLSRDNLKNTTTLPNLSGSIKQAESDTRSFTAAQKELTQAKREQLQVESQLRVELLELKKRNAELTIQAKEKLAADKEALQLAKTKSAADKQAAADAVAAGRERILQLKAEQEAIEKAAEAERTRASAEQGAIAGTYNPGGGKGNGRPANEPLTLSVNQGNIELVKIYEKEIARLGVEVKNAETAFNAGEISQNAYKKVVVESVEKVQTLKRNITDLNKEMKLSANVNDAERNSLGRAQALIAQYTNEKKKLNLATEEGRLLNDNYNKAIQKTNEFILKNADAETQRTKNIGNYNQAAQLIVDALEKEKIKLQSLTTGYQNFSQQVQISRQVITGFAGGISNPTEFKAAQSSLIATTEKINGLKTEIADSRTKIEGFNKELAKPELQNLGKNAEVGKKGVEGVSDTVKKATTETSKFAGGFTKAYSALRTLANILPGIGIGGLVALIAGPLVEAFEELFKKTSKAGEAINKTFSESTASVSGNISRLQALVSIAKDVSNSDAERKEALGALNKEYDGFNGKLTLANINTDKATKLINEQTNAIVRQAKIKGVEDLITEESKKAAENLRTDLSDNLTILQRAQNLAVSTFGGASAGQADALVSGLKTRDKKAKESTGIINEYKDALGKLLAEDAKEGTLFKEPKPPKVAATKESTKATLDSDFELYKIDQQRKIKLLDEQVNDQKLSFDKRIQLLNAFSTASLELIDRQKDEELRKNDEKEKALRANLVGAKGTERNNLLVELQNNETARKLIEAKSAAERLAVFDANEKKYTDIVDNENTRRLKIQKNAYDKTMKLIDDEAANRKAKADKDFTSGSDGLQQRYEQGKLSLKEYNKQRLELDFAYSIESIDIEIDRIKKVIAVSAFLPIAKGAALKALADLEKKLATDVANHHKKAEADKLASSLKTLQDIQKTANDVFGLVDGLLNAQQIATKNKLKEQSDDAEKKAQRDIDIVNASTASEQDKAAKIQIINARLAAQKEQIAQKEKKSEQDRAKFQKAITIFNIILSTTLAVIKAYTEGDPYTKVARAIIAGVAGAAQLAIAAATPIPKYFRGKGKGEAYEGPAMVNDGAHLEVIERADGSIEFPDGRNVITHVGKNDIVHPNREEWVNAAIRAAFRDSNMRSVRSSSGDDPLSRKLDKQTQLLKQIADKKELHLGASDKGMVALWKFGASVVQYTNENTNW